MKKIFICLLLICFTYVTYAYEKWENSIKISVKNKFLYKYYDNNNEERYLRVDEIKNKSIIGTSFYIVVNKSWVFDENFLKKNIIKIQPTNTEFIKKTKGFLALIPIYNFPVSLGSAIGAPVINLFKLNVKKNKFIVILGNYNQGLSFVNFEKDKNSIFKLNREFYWKTNLVNSYMNTQSQFFINKDVIFVIAKKKNNKPYLRAIIDGPCTNMSSLYMLIYPSSTYELASLGDEKSKYQWVCAEYEKKMMEKLIAENPKLKMTANDVKKAIESFRQQNNNIKLTEIFKSKLTEEQLKEKLCNDKNMQFNLSFSNWVEKNHRKYSEITVSEAEIKKFYEDYGRYLSEFCRKKQWNNPSSTGQSYEFIKNEIKRLKYYRLDELLTNPPKVEINTK